MTSCVLVEQSSLPPIWPDCMRMLQVGSKKPYDSIQFNSAGSKANSFVQSCRGSHSFGLPAAGWTS